MTHLCRRTVLKGAAASCGAGLLAACGGGAKEAVAPPASSSGGPGAPADGGGVRASLVPLSEVPVGGAVSSSAPDGTKVLVTRPAEDEAVAFSAVCPHEGCTVAPDGGQLTCPCHGSQFELSGEVKRGPARRGLTPFPVRIVDGQVLPA